MQRCRRHLFAALPVGTPVYSKVFDLSFYINLSALASTTRSYLTRRLFLRHRRSIAPKAKGFDTADKNLASLAAQPTNLPAVTSVPMLPPRRHKQMVSLISAESWRTASLHCHGGLTRNSESETRVPRFNSSQCRTTNPFGHGMPRFVLTVPRAACCRHLEQSNRSAGVVTDCRTIENGGCAAETGHQRVDL